MKIQYITIYLLLFILIAPCGSNPVHASASDSATGDVSVRIVKKDRSRVNRVNINHIKYELSINLDEVLVSQDNVISTEIQGLENSYEQDIKSIITSSPNGNEHMSYGIGILSEKTNKENNTGFTNVILKNDDGSDIEVRLEISSKEITFDRYGKANLDIKSRFFFDKEKVRGTYRGFYYIVVSH